MQTARRQGEHASRSGSSPALHVAVVMAPDGVVFAAIEASPGALRRRLGEFTRAHAATKLWPDDSAEVLRLLGQGQIDRAVDLYFSRVGQRWDPEFLHRQVIADPPPDSRPRGG